MRHRPENGRRRGRRSLPALAAAVLLAGQLLAPASLLGHGGEDHGAAEALPAATPGSASLSTHGTAGRFELLLKYPAPEAGKPVRLRFFLADYATNRAVEGARFVVASRPRGLSTQSPPAMTAPGIYELVAVFPADTVYSLVATLAAGDASEQIVLPNVYAGEAAERFLAEHGGGPQDDAGGNGIGKWVVPLIIVGAAILGILSFLGVRSRKASAGPAGDAPVAGKAASTVQPINIPDRREEENR